MEGGRRVFLSFVVPVFLGFVAEKDGDARHLLNLSRNGDGTVGAGAVEEVEGGEEERTHSDDRPKGSEGGGGGEKARSHVFSMLISHNCNAITYYDKNHYNARPKAS